MSAEDLGFLKDLVREVTLTPADCMREIRDLGQVVQAQRQLLSVVASVQQTLMLNAGINYTSEQRVKLRKANEDLKAAIAEIRARNS